MIFHQERFNPPYRKEKTVRSGVLRLNVVLWVALVATSVSHGAPFTINNLAVVRVGQDSSVILSSNATRVSILEFSPSGGSPVQILGLDFTGTNAFTLTGNERTQGTLSVGGLSPYLTLAGYNRAEGLSNPSSSTDARVVARVGFDGTVNYSTKLTSAFSALPVRGAATSDGTNFWVSGGNNTTNSIVHTTLGSSAATSLQPLATNTLAQVQVLNGNLFVSSLAAAGGSVYQVGTGLPTSGSQTLTNSIPVAAGKTYQSFYFTDLGSGNNWNGTGFDALYAVDSTADRLEKWVFDGSNWVARSFVSLTGIENVTAANYNKNIVLYATNATDLNVLLDTSGHGGNISGSFASIASAGAGFAFRGVAIVPEPGSLALCGLAGAGLVGVVIRRRRMARLAG